MNPRISIEFDMAEGAVVRMLGLVERRGFAIHGLGMSEDEEGQTASLTLELSPRDPARRVDVLENQLRRLHGVRRTVSFDPVEVGDE